MKYDCPLKRRLTPYAGVAVIASALLWSTPLLAGDYSYSGESTTILRMRKSVNNDKLYPAYEYLRLNLANSQKDGSDILFYMGAWGRADLGDRTTAQNTDADLQYAYLTYRAAKNNAMVTAGRQFISDGVAAERIDGVYLRSDLLHGFGVSAYLGDSVITEPNLPTHGGGGLIYGGRISHTIPKYYAVGVSALKNQKETGGRYREEGGADLWLRPHSMLDLTGRSTYNNITKGWMENSYSLAVIPLPAVRIGAEFSAINLNDYLHGVTTSALSLANPAWNSNDKQTIVGANATYTGFKETVITTNYRRYNYNRSGDANYFGIRASRTFPQSFVLGGSFYRMEGDSDRLRYFEMRGYASKKIDKTDLTIDVINLNFDRDINNVKSSFAITGAATHQCTPQLKVGADLEYSKSPDFSKEVRALVKLVYTFDSTISAERGTKSEK